MDVFSDFFFFFVSILFVILLLSSKYSFVLKSNVCALHLYDPLFFFIVLSTYVKMLLSQRRVTRTNSNQKWVEKSNNSRVRQMKSYTCILIALSLDYLTIWCHSHQCRMYCSYSSHSLIFKFERSLQFCINRWFENDFHISTFWLGYELVPLSYHTYLLRALTCFVSNKI